MSKQSRTYENKHIRRVVALMIMTVIICILAGIRSFEFQIVEGENYLNAVEKTSYSTITVTAARGEIVDRNGIPFTQNKVVYNVEFDYNFLDKKTQNDTIYKLIKLFENENIEWIDELPISKTAPYEFDSTKQKEIARLKKEINVNDYTTAQDCLLNIYRDFDIKKYKTDKGKCTHCGEKFDECKFVPVAEEYCRKIAGVRYQMLLKDFSGYTTRFTFAEDIPTKMVALIREFSSDFVGVEVVEKAKRTYIGGNVASPIIGSIGPIYAEDVHLYQNKDSKTMRDGYLMTDYVGKDGIEKAMEDELRGKNGTMKVIQDARGNIIDVREEIAPIPGKTVQLTLDFKFQEQLQVILADYIENFNKTNKKGKKAEAGAIVVLDAKTNGVLASVSYPYYDINEYKKNYTALANDPQKPLFNRALNGLYAPGSTFKPIVAAAGLTEGEITPTSTVRCNHVYSYWGTKPTDYQPKCLGNHGDIAVSQALNHSCNIFFYDVGRILGIKSINEYANYFGLGTDTGLEISTRTGHLSTQEYAMSVGDRWEAGNVVQAAIGQGYIQITPLQMATEASTIANKGTRFQTHLVKNILSNDQKEVLTAEAKKVESSFDLSEPNYNAIKDGMIMVADSVRAPNQLTDLPYKVAMKTGTPQVTVTKTNNAFIAYAPAENPEIAISVMVEDGDGTNQLCRKIIDAYEASKQK